MSHLTEQELAVLDGAVEGYIAALNDLDVERYLSLFRSNCVVRDPYGVSMYQGVTELRQYAEMMVSTWVSFAVVPTGRYYGGHERVVFPWAVRATAKNGKVAVYDGITVLTLQDTLIDGLESYWDAPRMFEQIKD